MINVSLKNCNSREYSKENTHPTSYSKFNYFTYRTY